MNGNEKYFQQKFIECSKFIVAKPTDIVSLKYREIRDHNYYLELLDELSKVKGLKIDNIGYVLQGNAYKISYGSQEIIIVEHETGLEILYIAGAIAGIIGLVLQVSSIIGHHGPRSFSFPYDLRDVEMRYFDNQGKFIEERRHNYLPYEIFLPSQQTDQDIELIKKRLDKIEKKLNQLNAKFKLIK